MFIASTEYRDRQELITALKGKANEFGVEWTLKNKQILAFRDLREFPYREICDIGTAEEFAVLEWADSDDSERQRDFVALLNTALRAKLRALGVVFEHRAPMFCYYVRGNSDLRPVPFGYSGGKRRTNRDVFKPYYSKDRQLSYCRHSAFKGQFYRLSDRWYLEVTPTYYFTKDGIEHLPNYEALLKGIKRLEKNNAVRGQLVMWAGLLTQTGDMYLPDYPYLAFGNPLSFELDVGLDDAVWLERDEKEASLSDGQATLALEVLQ